MSASTAVTLRAGTPLLGLGLATLLVADCRGGRTAMGSSLLAALGRALPARTHGVDVLGLVLGPINGRRATRVACVRVGDELRARHQPPPRELI
jgi:hypothetical protein